VPGIHNLLSITNEMDMEIQANHLKEYGFEVATGMSSGVRSELGRITKINFMANSM
jgi:hypothetical protein